MHQRQLKRHPGNEHPFGIFWLVLLVVLGGAVSLCAGDRPNCNGLELTYPKNEPDLAVLEVRSAAQGLRFYEGTMIVDKKGRVEDFIPNRTEDTVLFRNYQAYFGTIKFEPGKLNGKKVGQQLPVKLEFRSQRRYPDIFYPVGIDQSIEDIIRYRRALVMNGLALPEIVYFPSYFYKFTDTAKGGMYPYVLLKMMVKKDGRAEAVEVLKTTAASGYTDQIQSAVRWAQFTPMKVGKKTLEKEVFMLVSLYPFTEYPTSVIDSLEADSLKKCDHRRVKILPDTSAIMAVPVPENLRDGLYIDRKYPTFFNGMQDALVRIDTLGEAHLLALSHRSDNVKMSIARQLTDIPFYPALSFSGTPIEFEGIIRVESLDRSLMKYQFNWLQ